MFASLKNKIKEETGSDLPALPASRLSNSGRHHLRGRLSSSTSITSIDDIQALEQKDAELTSLRLQCNELTSKVTELTTRIEDLEVEKERLEKANDLLMESVKVAQTQKDLMSEEQEKIQNVQLEEITRLKSLLSFREQEAVDRLSLLKQNQQQIETLKAESDRLKMIEPMLEDIQDEAERLRHSAQLDKNNLTTTLAAIEEENRHLKSRLQIIDQSRLDIISSLSSDEKVQALVQERKLLEQHLEEAHLQLSDIKSSWSGQNLALETQVSRLSRQVAEETTEKRKSIKERDEFIEKVKQLEFDLQKVNDEILHRDNKIKLLEEEIDELSSALRECRTDSEQEVSYLKSKAESSANEIAELKSRLSAADERLSEYVENSEQVTQALRKQNLNLQEQLQQANDALETEKQERLTALLRNAEISQSEEILKKELRLERDEVNELNEKQAELQKEIKQKEEELARTIAKLTEVNSVIHSQSDRIAQIDNYQHEINEKNKTIKILNQRMSDLKKTLQEIKSNNFSDGSGLTGSSVISSDKIAHDYKNNGSSSGPIVMDEVNFKYLKHVIVKFLTSREVEARHLIRAVATLLQLSHEEEQLLHDTLNWKMSWFGSKPDHGTGQRAVSIPPS